VPGNWQPTILLALAHWQFDLENGPFDSPSQ